MAERVALYLQDSHDLRDGLAYAKYAEEKGFEAVWQAESRLVRDAVVPMAAYAAVTNRIKVGSGVINNWTRNIGLLAMTLLTLDDLAPDRIDLDVIGGGAGALRDSWNRGALHREAAAHGRIDQPFGHHAAALAAERGDQDRNAAIWQAHANRRRNSTRAWSSVRSHRRGLWMISAR